MTKEGQWVGVDRKGSGGGGGLAEQGGSPYREGCEVERSRSNYRSGRSMEGCAAERSSIGKEDMVAENSVK